MVTQENLEIKRVDHIEYDHEYNRLHQYDVYASGIRIGTIRHEERRIQATRGRMKYRKGWTPVLLSPIHEVWVRHLPSKNDAMRVLIRRLNVHMDDIASKLTID